MLCFIAQYSGVHLAEYVSMRQMTLLFIRGCWENILLDCQLFFLHVNYRIIET